MLLRRVPATRLTALLLLPLLAAALLAGVPRVRASCAAPPYAYARTARITACEAVDPDRQPAVQQFVQTLRSEKQDTFAGQLLAAYRGALITVTIQRSTRRAPNAARPRGSVPAFDVRPDATSSFGERDGLYFIPTQALKPCAALPPGKVLVLDERFSCCDGDPNVPCLLGTDALRSPSPSLPPTFSPPSSAADAATDRR
jgi:hypothetical protein